MSRREALKIGCCAAGALIAGAATGASSGSEEERVEESKNREHLNVSVVQFRSGRDLAENVRRHCDYISECAKDGARVVVFPECSISGYFDDAIENATASELEKAELAVASVAREAGVYVIAGSPTKIGSVTYNSALVITPKGRIVERYHKVQLAGERWATPGDHLSVFPIDGTLCSIIICHDERYPELVRLPVIAGARVVFYVSHESGVAEAHKIEPYRAQIVARAVENGVYVVQANAPGDRKTLEGSHGQSRVIKPDGNIIREAGIFDEEVVSASLDLSKANGSLARNSLRCEFLSDWWSEGAAKVRNVGG